MLDVNVTRRPVPTVPPAVGVLGVEVLSWGAGRNARSDALGKMVLLVVLVAGLITSARAALRCLLATLAFGCCAASLLRGIDWLAARKETVMDLSRRSGSLIPYRGARIKRCATKESPSAIHNKRSLNSKRQPSGLGDQDSWSTGCVCVDVLVGAADIPLL